MAARPICMDSRSLDRAAAGASLDSRLLASPRHGVDLRRRILALTESEFGRADDGQASPGSASPSPWSASEERARRFMPPHIYICTPAPPPFDTLPMHDSPVAGQSLVTVERVLAWRHARRACKRRRHAGIRRCRRTDQQRTAHHAAVTRPGDAAPAGKHAPTPNPHRAGLALPAHQSRNACSCPMLVRISRSSRSTSSQAGNDLASAAACPHHCAP